MLAVMCSSLVLCAGIGVGDGSSDALAKACEKLSSADSYSFKVTSKSEGSGGFTPPASDEPIAGQFQKSRPIHLKRGNDEIYRDKDQAVFKAEGGEWKTLERPSFGGPRGGGGGRRGGDGGGAEGGGEAGGREGGDAGGGGGGGGDREGGGRGRRGGGGPGGGPGGSPQMAAFALNSTPVPGMIVSDVSKKVSDVTTETKDGKTVYVAKLTPEGARELAGTPGGPPRGRRDGGGGSGGGGGEGGGRPPEASGTLRITAGTDGQIEKIELDTNSKFSFGGDREFERHRTTTIELSNVGKTQVDVPKDADSKLHSM